MKIAVLSDIHGNLPALEAVLADVARQGVDATVNLGDIASGPLQPAETLDFLMSRDFLTIAGNHERQVLALVDRPERPFDLNSTDGYTAAQLAPAHVAWLRALPPAALIADEVLLCHGTPGSDLVYWLETVVPGYRRDAAGEAPAASQRTSTTSSHLLTSASGVRPATDEEIAQRLGGQAHPLVLCGHTHVPRVGRCGATLIVNPGSVGLQAYDDDHPLPHVIENGTPAASYALVERRAAGWSAELRRVGYGHEAQARLAASRNRPDWARGLATGLALRPSGGGSASLASTAS